MYMFIVTYIPPHWHMVNTPVEIVIPLCMHAHHKYLSPSDMILVTHSPVCSRPPLSGIQAHHKYLISPVVCQRWYKYGFLFAVGKYSVHVKQFVLIRGAVQYWAAEATLQRYTDAFIVRA